MKMTDGVNTKRTVPAVFSNFGAGPKIGGRPKAMRTYGWLLYVNLKIS